MISGRTSGNVVLRQLLRVAHMFCINAAMVTWQSAGFSAGPELYTIFGYDAVYVPGV